MNILFIDYMCYKKHKVFNSIHIKSLLKLGHKLCLVGKKDQFEEYDGKGNIEIKIMPAFHSKFSNYSIYRDIEKLLWIKKNIKIKEYDLIIVPTYDILSLIFFRIKGNVFIINHNNISLFSESKIGKIRLLLTRLLPKNYTHICLNELMTDTMKKLLPQSRVYHVPHGLSVPSINGERPEFIHENESFVFCPINRNFDNKDLYNLITSPYLHQTLENLNLYLYIKNLFPIKNKTDRVKILKKFLEKSEYDYMMENAKAIILPYDSSLGTRCSGILFEGISRNTHIISSDIKSMRVYDGSVSISYYKNIYELCRCLGDCLKNKVYNDFKLFNPDNYWKSILKKSNFTKE